VAAQVLILIIGETLDRILNVYGIDVAEHESIPAKKERYLRFIGASRELMSLILD
jgi:hypothetical protein